MRRAASDVNTRASSGPARRRSILTGTGTCVPVQQSDGDYTDDQIYNDSIQDNWFSVGSCVGTVQLGARRALRRRAVARSEFLRGKSPQPVRDFLFGVETGNTTYKQWSGEPTSRVQ